MLIFYCTRAFRKFIEPCPTRNSQPLVSSPPGRNIKDDAAILRSEVTAGAHQILQWQCHVIEGHGRFRVLAIEVDTRFAMVFTTLRAGEPEAFINAVIDRLFDLQWHFAKKLQIVSRTEHEAWMHNFIGAHRKFRFFERTDRSVQAHVNDVAQAFAWAFERWESGLLKNHQERIILDISLNDILRSTRDRREYFYPDEEMLLYWLQTYGGWTSDGVARLRGNARN